MSANTEGQGVGQRRRGLSLLQIGPVLTLVLVGAMAVRPIADSSFLWHIRAGSLQLENLRVIAADPFSYTMFSVEWRTQSWLGELIYAGLERTFDSYAWVNILVFVLGSLTMLFVGLSVYKSVPSAFAVTIVLVASFWLFAPFLKPRPVIYSFALLALLVVVLQWPEKVVWAVVPIIWLWATLHGSWVVGGALIVLEWLRTGDRRIFKAGVAALLATLATAHGIGTWTVLFDFYGAGEALDLLGEWSTPNFASYLQAPYLLIVVGLILGALWRRFEVRDLIVILPFLALGMSANRSVVPATIVLAHWAARAIPRIELPETDKPLPVIAGAWVATIAIVLVPLVVADLGAFDSRKFPNREIMEVTRDTTVFHSDVVGGFTIFAEGPDRLVYIDDRAELYGAEMFQEYLDIVSGTYEDAFAKYGFEGAIVEEEWLLYDRLIRDGWQVEIDDGELKYMVPGG